MPQIFQHASPLSHPHHDTERVGENIAFCQTESSPFMTASWVEEQLVSPESIPLGMARPHENSSQQSPDTLKSSSRSNWPSLCPALLPQGTT